MATTVNIPRETTMQGIRDALEMIAVAQTSQGTDITSWAGVEQAVRHGLGPVAFPVGAQLTANHTKYGKLVWDVVAHDNAKNPFDANAHTMTLLLHTAIPSIQFDGVEALYVAPSGLAAGTYHFTIPDWDAQYGGNATYQFTTTKQVPANGVVVLNWAYQKQVTDGTIVTYNSVTSTEAIETVKPTKGTGGTNLGTADGTGENMNHIHRARYGSNNYAQSAIRQLLNSAAAANSVWKSQTKFDRPPTWAASTPGFMNGLDTEFLQAVKPVDFVTKTNTVFETNGYTKNNKYTLRDKFWLASVDELGFATENNIAEGTKFTMYAKATNADRIKYNSDGAVQYWWMRSPNPSLAMRACNVYPDGSLDDGRAYNSIGLVPACVIY